MGTKGVTGVAVVIFVITGIIVVFIIIIIIILLLFAGLLLLSEPSLVLGFFFFFLDLFFFSYSETLIWVQSPESFLLQIRVSLGIYIPLPILTTWLKWSWMSSSVQFIISTRARIAFIYTALFIPTGLCLVRGPKVF